MTEKEQCKEEYEFVLKIPFISDYYTRRVKTAVEKSNINARVVATPGQSVKSLLKSKTKADCYCDYCERNMDCTIVNYVYQATCKSCHKTYIGGSARPIPERQNEHEASVRLLNSRTTLGYHALSHSSEEAKTRAASLKGQRDVANLFEKYSIRIIGRYKDPLETFINEGLLIKKLKPAINNMTSNGFIE